LKDLIRREKKGSKGNIGIPLEPWYWHFPVTPSHDFPQKVRGYVVRLTRACEDDSNENLQPRRCKTGLQIGLPLPSSLSGDAFQVRSRSAGLHVFVEKKAPASLILLKILSWPLMLE
jgi:hypothetical protein